MRTSQRKMKAALKEHFESFAKTMGILNSGTQPIQFIITGLYLRTVHVANSISGRFRTVHRLMLELEGRGFNEKEKNWSHYINPSDHH